MIALVLGTTSRIDALHVHFALQPKSLQAIVSCTGGLPKCSELVVRGLARDVSSCAARLRVMLAMDQKLARLLLVS